MRPIVSNLTLWVFTLLVLSSAPKPSPAPVLSQEQMTAILVDLHLAKALATAHTEDEAAASLVQYAPAICQAHATDWETIYQSTQYYLAHPKQLRRILKAVTQELTALQVQPE